MMEQEWAENIFMINYLRSPRFYWLVDCICNRKFCLLKLYIKESIPCNDDILIIIFKTFCGNNVRHVQQ